MQKHKKMNKKHKLKKTLLFTKKCENLYTQLGSQSNNRVDIFSSGGTIFRQ